MNFGDKLRLLREDQGLTQAKMAKEIGVCLRAYQNYESGKIFPKDTQVYQRISTRFGVSVNYLMGGDEDESAAPIEGRLKAQEILKETEALYTGGFLSQEDEAAFVAHMQQIFRRVGNAQNARKKL